MNFLWYFKALTVPQLRIAQRLRDFYLKNGRRPFLYEMGVGHERIGLPSQWDILREYDSLDDAYRAADIPVIRAKDIDRIHAVQVFYEEHQRTPKQFEAKEGLMMYSLNSLLGSGSYSRWNELITAAGFAPRTQSGQTASPPVDELIKSVRKLALELNRLPSGTDIERSEITPTWHWYKKKIGDIETVHKVARLRELLKLPETVHEEMAEFVRQLAQELGHSPRQRDFLGRKYSLAAIEKEFGSQEACYAEIGLPLPRRRGSSDHFMGVLREGSPKGRRHKDAQHEVNENMPTDDLATKAGSAAEAFIETLPAAWDIDEETLNLALLKPGNGTVA